MRICIGLFLTTLIVLPLAAVQTGVLVDEGYETFISGELKNVALSRSGELGTAPNLTEIADLDESSIWKVVAAPDGGFVIGTGNKGRVLKVAPDGTLEVLFEPDVLISRGLAFDPAGHLYVATSPKGAIYRLPATGGKPELFYDPDPVYIWDLVVEEGALWIATGFPAQLIRLPLEDENAEVETWYSSKDEHFTSLLRKGGEWLLGSSPRGVVYGVSGPGKARAIYKANEKEIRQVALAGDGLLVATFSDMPPPAKTQRPNDSGELPPFEVKAERPKQSLLPGGSGQGYLVRVDAGGFARPEWHPTSGAVFSLAPMGDEHWLLGSNDEGRLYSFSNRHEWGLLHQIPHGGEISAILRGAGERAPFYIFTSNPAAVYQLGGISNEPSSFTSDVLDARQVVRWGRLESAFAREGEVVIETRTGFTDEPDATWSDWLGLEEDRIVSPIGRYVQYRLQFPAKSEALFLRARIFYTMPNVAPVFARLRVLDYGASIRSSQHTPQILDLASVLNENKSSPHQLVRDLTKLERRPERTFRTVVWMVTDPNGDDMRFDVSFQAVGEEAWTVLARNLTEPIFLFNAAGFEPGEYRFKVVATDSPSNTASDALSAELVSGLVRLDTTVPEIEFIGLKDGVVSFRVVSDVSRLVAAQITVEGAEPVALRPRDGLFDDLREDFDYALLGELKGTVSIVFEVLDESGNQSVFPLQLSVD